MRHLEPNILLGRSVIDKAVLDSVDVTAAREWFDLKNPDFHDICFVANLNPVSVERQYRVTHQRLLNNEVLDIILDELEE